jgi:formylglycine-generating enzyme required for sulfatase activity
MGTDEPGSVSKDLTGFEMDRRGWKPRHSVTLSPYCMDVTEVTVGKYKACVDDGKCTAPGKDSGDENNTYPNKTGYPISLVDWQQAKKFCEAYGHQLPSEAQWEFAARGPDAHEYPFAWTSSDNITCTDSLANESGGKKLVAGFGEGSRCAKTAHGAWSVGSAPDGKSPFGMFDMAGNVMEWVLDDYDLGYYEQSKGAKDPVNLKSTGAKSMGVVRGGGWSHGGGNGDKAPGWTMHAWFREPQPRDAQDAEIGFRCVAQPKG